MTITSLKWSQKATATREVLASNDVRTLIANQLGVDVKRVTDEAHFTDDLGADWLDRLELMIVIEDRFADVGIKNEDVDQEVVGDLIRHVENVDNERRRRPIVEAAPLQRSASCSGRQPRSVCGQFAIGMGEGYPPSDQRWHAGAVGSSAQIDGASTCCKHRLTAKSVRRTATTNQIMVVRDIGSSLSQLIGHVSLRLKGPGDTEKAPPGRAGPSTDVRGSTMSELPGRAPQWDMAR
jgi:acyl carrier protein